MNITDVYPDIKKLSIFKNTSNEALCAYIKEESFYIKSYSSGDDICSPYEDNDSVGIITSGVATVNSSDEERSVLLATLSAGAVFGIANLYAKELDFPTRISAKNACKILFIKKDALRELIENDKDTLKSFLAFQSNKIIYLNKKINSFTAGGAERRLALFLSKNSADGIYSSKVSMSALAEMLDIGRASLYRAFDSLEDAGLIKRIDKKTFTVNNDLINEKYPDRSSSASVK